MVTEQHLRAEKVVLGKDNLSRDTLSFLYETFPGEEAVGIAQTLEIQYRPKQGGWVNRGERALSAMTSQCLDRRIDTQEKLSEGLEAWQVDRNEKQKLDKGQFTTAGARINLLG
jgi:hypothetical protein